MNTQRQGNDFDFSKKLIEQPVVQERKYSRAMVKGMSAIGNFMNKLFKNGFFQFMSGIVISLCLIVSFISAISDSNRRQIEAEKAQAAKIAAVGEEQAKLELQKGMVVRNALIKKIAAVPEDEFAKMMVFVKDQLQVGEKVAQRGLYAGDYMMKNQKTYNINYALEKKSNIIKYQREHEKFVYSRIVLLGDVYQAVRSQETNDVEFINLERFITWMNYYKNDEKYIDENLQATVDHIIVNTDITDEINKKYPDPVKNQ